VQVVFLDRNIQNYISDFASSKIIDYINENINNIGDMLAKKNIEEHLLSKNGVKKEAYRKGLYNKKTKDFLEKNCITDLKNNRYYEKINDLEYKKLEQDKHIKGKKDDKNKSGKILYNII
jgi:Ni,Fe-hydrogenase I large subunit